MNISEMTTATFADFVNASGDHIANIMQNERVAALFSDTEKQVPHSLYGRRRLGAYG